MKGKIILSTLIAIMLLPVCVKASDCDYNEQANLRKIASNVTASYDYIESSDSVTFSVTLTNLTSDIYIVDSATGRTYYYNNSPELTINGYSAGTNIRYSIYASKANCIKEYLTIKYVNLPSYNKYYKDPLCTGLEQYSVCSKWQNINMTYDDFTKTVSAYKNNTTNNNSEAEDNTQTSSKSIFDYVFEFIISYYLYMVIGASIIIVVVSYIRGKRNGFDL